MKIKPIKNKADYCAALRDVEALMGAKANTADGERLDALVTLIDACERRHFPLELPDPVEAIKFQMEQKGLIPKDLEPMIGRLNGFTKSLTISAR
jgi:HTH-type transcriptional regulator/antitoxin HigA